MITIIDKSKCCGCTACFSICPKHCVEMKMDEEVPVGVAINEAVELAKLFGGEDSGSFVNGILGKIASGKKDSGEEHKKPRRQTHSAKIIIRSSKKDGKASKDQKNPERASEESTE